MFLCCAPLDLDLNAKDVGPWVSCSRERGHEGKHRSESQGLTINTDRAPFVIEWSDAHATTSAASTERGDE